MAAIRTNGMTLAERVAGPLPVHMTDWFAVLALAVWGLVPAVIGYLRFERSDL